VAVGTPAYAIVQDVDPSALAPTRKHQQTTHIISKVLARYHYRKSSLDDRWSERIFDNYFKTLDPNKSFFLRSDVDRYANYRHGFDEAIRQARLQPAFDIFRLYRKRVEARVARAQEFLKSGFDFSKDEEYVFDREDLAWAKDEAELDEIWRQRVKNDVLGLRLAGKTDADIQETLVQRYEGIARRARQFTADDVFETFINAYTVSLEPHTSYMSPELSENFDISMSLSLEGVGAVLRSRNEYTEVQSVIPGGPAAMSGQLKEGDRIVGVGQGASGTLEDVVGWRLDEVVKLIRGPKGTKVRLQILPKGAEVEEQRTLISLVRDKIKLEEQAAKKQLIDDAGGLVKTKIGVIEIPTFYRDFQGEARGEKNFRSTTRDVRRMLNELKQEGVDGIVVDLRDNGGGSLAEATELTGLFIDSGPIVQVKDAFGDIEVERDVESGVAYSGPLVVLVNRNSASASEIFAGAIQDYQRGIVVGEPTFGKGTVQTLIDLDRFVRGSNPKLGRLRLTMAQFYRINGESTQFRGVVPDIVFPTGRGSSEHGERSLDNALPWDHIKPAKYSPAGVSSVAALRETSVRRIRDDPGFQLLLEQEKLLDELSKGQAVSLNEAKRKMERDARELLTREYKNRFRTTKGLKPLDSSTPSALDEDDEAERDDDETKALARIQVEEAARILSDYIAAQRPLAAALP